MNNRDLALLALVASFAFVMGCGSSTPPAKPDMPVKTSQGQDKKGNKTKSMEATLEEPAK